MDAPSLALLSLAAVAAGAVISGLGVRVISPRAVSIVTIAGVAIAAGASLMQALQYAQPQSFTLYQWGPAGYGLNIGFLLDSLSVLMMVVVTTVSLLIHIYSIGYMRGDPGYVRFFCYLSLFTFAMLLLVMADNFLLLFIGWEGVGLVSYLLIGFWFTRPRAAAAGLKAFLVNRVGDLGFLLGMGAVLAGVGSLDYATVFDSVPTLMQTPAPIGDASLLGMACLLLFVGAMGKSAQVPLHVWLPDSMEGPTPISAMIHAATMVTAGIFMVARLSPMFEGSEAVLNMILLIGGITALFMGLLGLVSYDIKRVIAYSTLSQLGYMTMALGASAYAAGIFHLFTHAFFKALLFLAAGSVILAMHHEQDIRKMGGLGKRLPITFLTFLAGTFALMGIPGFAGFYSKESIIAALGHSELLMAPVGYVMALVGVAVTVLYSLRLGYYVFTGEARTSAAQNASESDWSVKLPLLALAVLTVLSPLATGAFLTDGMLDDAIHVLPQHDVLATMSHDIPWGALLILGVALIAGTIIYRHRARQPLESAKEVPWWRKVLERKYGFDVFYEQIVVRVGLRLGRFMAQVSDVRLIDGAMVGGVARAARAVGARLRPLQSGLIGHYALAMLLGLVVALGYLLWRGDVL